MSENQSYPGSLITFEGADGVGKSTHIRFLAQSLEERGEDVVCIREPGGTLIGEQLREVVLDPNNNSMSAQCELLIYEAARAQIVHEVIIPALKQGSVVICDRFYDSTVAYQGYGRGLDISFINSVNAFASSALTPDMTLLLYAGKDYSAGLKRVSDDRILDRLELEGLDFQQRVIEGYHLLAKENPQRIRPISSDGSKAATASLIFNELASLFSFFKDRTYYNEEYFNTINR